jgi:N4-gp56 family major capsid protein
MTTTTFGTNDPKTKKIWSGQLARATNASSYWKKKFVGVGPNNIIEEKRELTSDKGDTIYFDLSVQLRGEPTDGDSTLEGNEEEQRFFTDQVMIDQTRKSVSAGGAMSRKRTDHDLRENARNLLADYFKALQDELFFMYLCGARGINEEFIRSTAYTGHAGNPLQAPDATHLLFGGAATSKASITTADTMSRALIERAEVQAKMIRSIDTEASNMVPLEISGEDHFVVVMSSFQEHSLRTSATAADWAAIQTAAITHEGKNNPIFMGKLGMIKAVVLHAHERVIRFSDYGAGSNLPAARALFMGRQAGVVAYGTPGGARFSWEEEMKDFGNKPIVACGQIFGVKKSRFNGRDFGVLALDTYAKNPNT